MKNLHVLLWGCLSGIQILSCVLQLSKILQLEYLCLSFLTALIEENYFIIGWIYKSLMETAKGH